MFGALLGAAVGAYTQNHAANKASKLSERALADQRVEQERVWSAANPYIDAGQGALGRMTDPNAFKTSPGYNFRLDQGLEATAGNQAVNGLLRSGGALKALNDYGQGMASDEYGKWFAQQGSIAGMGLQGAQLGAGAANQITSAIGQNADNQAGAAFTKANAWGKLAGSVGGAFDRMSSFGGG